MQFVQFDERRCQGCSFYFLTKKNCTLGSTKNGGCYQGNLIWKVIFYKTHLIHGYSRVQKSIENWSVCSRMALGEVGVSLP